MGLQADLWLGVDRCARLVMLFAQTGLDPVIGRHARKSAWYTIHSKPYGNLMLSNAHRVSIHMSSWWRIRKRVEIRRNGSTKAKSKRRCLMKIKPKICCSADAALKSASIANWWYEYFCQKWGLKMFQLVCLEYENEKLSGDLPITFILKAREMVWLYKQWRNRFTGTGLKRTIEYCLCSLRWWTEIGIGEEDYLPFKSVRLRLWCLGASNSIRATIEDRQALNGYLFCHLKR